MASETAKRDIDAVFGLAPVRPDPDDSASFGDEIGGLDGRDRLGASAFGGERFETPRVFSPFWDEDIREAGDLADRLGELADAAPTPEEGLERAAAAAFGAAMDNPGLAKHALGLFATHHPRGRGAPLPSLLQRSASAAGAGAAPAGTTVTMGSGATGAEAALDWFREDPLANEHHEHWHWVYPRLQGRAKPRHGELFYYMHQQMLARYDVERVGVGLPPVAPIEDYAASLGEGYDPGSLQVAVAVGPGRLQMIGFGKRPAGGAMVGGDRLSVEALAGWGRNLKAAAETRKIGEAGQTFPLDGADGSNALGDEAEPTGARLFPGPYGNHHGGGHGLISAASDDTGVMALPETAIRDPAFWRWHRHVDDVHFAYQDQLPPHDFGDAPGVALAGLSVAAEPAGFAELAPETRRQTVEAALGDRREAELRTRMRKGVYRLQQDAGAYAYEYLSHEPFYVALALDNPGDAPAPVTLRLFLLADDLTPIDKDLSVDRQARRFVIELDKVKIDAPPGRSLHARAGRDMSVIRRPAVVDPTEVADIRGAFNAPSTECTCGWPFGLLIPRGKREGMGFTLFAMLTDNRLDRVDVQKSCGSMSFCGVGEAYPDSRPMGYPFDRPLAGSVRAMAEGRATMRLLPLTIRRTDR